MVPIPGVHAWAVTKSCPALCNSIDCIPPGSAVHGTFQARILEWVAISFSSRSSQPRDWIWCLLSLLHWQADSIPLSHLGSPIPSVQFSSVAQSWPTLCDPMNLSMPGLPVHHKLPEFTQTHAHQVGDVIQPYHPLLSPSPPAPNPSQDQGLFQWVNSSHEVAKVLEFQLQYQSFQWTPRTYLLQDGLVGSPCSPRLSRVFSKTTVQK